MADISSLARLAAGATRNVVLASNTLVVLSIKIGGGVSNTELTKTILDNLISHLSNTSNPHSVTKAQVGLGSVDNVQQLPMSYLDTDTALAANSDTKVASQKATKAYVDTAVGAATGSQVKISAADTTSEYLGASITISNGSNTTNPLEKSIVNPGANEQLDIKFDQSKVDHGSIAGLGDDDHTQYHNDARGDARYYQKTEFTTSSTANAPVKLDAGGKIDVAQLPNSIMEYLGTWNASTNTPTLADGTGNAGDVYIVSVAGSQNLGSGSITFAAGDWVVCNGATWEKSINSNAVASVNGQTGAVTVNAINELTGDVTTSAASGSQSLSATIANGAVTGAKIASNTITDSNISTTAGIAVSKLAALTADEVVITDNNGFITNAGFAPGDIIRKDGSVAMENSLNLNSWNIDNVNELSDNTAVMSISVNLRKLKSTDGTTTMLDWSGDKNDFSNKSLSRVLNVESELTAGESFASDTSFLVRWGMDSLGENADRVYKAHYDSTSADKWHVIGIAHSTSAVSVGQTILVTALGTHTLLGSDTAFNAADAGKPVYLTASGAFSVTCPSSALQAVFKVGIVKSTTEIWIDKQLMYIA